MKVPHGLSVRWRYALVGMACVGIAASFASNMGVCVPEGRILRDKDYFKGAVDVVIHDPFDSIAEYVPGAVIFKSVHSKRYSDVNEFLNEFPKCCKFVAANSGDGGPEVSILDRIRGVHIVELSYDRRYATDDGAQKSARVTAKVAVTSCGIGRPYR
jgi:hypothetical protein